METMKSSQSESLPTFLLTELIRKEKASRIMRSNIDPSKKIGQYSADRSTIDKELIHQIFNSNKMNLGHKEKLASSILLGEFDVVEKKKTVTYRATSPDGFVIDSSKAKTLAHLKRHSHKNRFIELESTAANIQIAEPRDLIEQEKLRKVNSGPHSQGYYWAGKYIPVDDQLEPLGHSSKHLVDSLNVCRPEVRICISEAMKRANAEKSMKNAEEVRELRRIAARQKREYRDNVIQKCAVHKKLNNFREKLQERLKERNDPQIGVYMRCIDEPMVHYFLEKHKGYTMSIDAILNQVGTPIVPINSVSTSASDVEEMFENVPLPEQSNSLLAPSPSFKRFLRASTSPLKHSEEFTVKNESSRFGISGSSAVRTMERSLNSRGRYGSVPLSNDRQGLYNLDSDLSMMSSSNSLFSGLTIEEGIDTGGGGGINSKNINDDNNILTSTARKSKSIVLKPIREARSPSGLRKGSPSLQYK